MTVEAHTSIVDVVLAGRWRDPATGQPVHVPVRAVTIAPSLAGREEALLRATGLLEGAVRRICVVSDAHTFPVLGARIEAALEGAGHSIIPVHLGGLVHADDKTVHAIIQQAAHADIFVAVGSGTINDLVKMASFGLAKPCVVFATAASMNGYVSSTASISVQGQKKTLPAHSPLGVFVDLEMIATAPAPMAAAGLADVLCRSTAQTDWLLSHLLFDTAYSETPFALFGNLETDLIANAHRLALKDASALGGLMEALILSGFGMVLAGSSAPASQGEHLISHALEMFDVFSGPQPLHGSQIAVTTLIMARLQEQLLAGPCPQLVPGQLTDQAARACFGADIGACCWHDARPKALDAQQCAHLNAQVTDTWPAMVQRLRAVSRPATSLRAAFAAAGAPLDARGLGVSDATMARAIICARTIRNRYGFLDLAADAGMLNPQALMETD